MVLYKWKAGKKYNRRWLTARFTLGPEAPRVCVLVPACVRELLLFDMQLCEVQRIFPLLKAKYPELMTYFIILVYIAITNATHT